MNLFGAIGNGIGNLGKAVGRGTNAWLDFASMGGAAPMLNDAYGGALPDDVRGQLRRSYLQNIAQSLAMGQPGLAPMLQQQTIGNMAQRGMQQQLRQAISGAVNEDGTPNYGQLSAIYARLGDPENSKRYGDLAQQQQMNRTNMDKMRMEQQQQTLALKSQLFGRVSDQRSYDAALAQARKLGINDMPEMYNPQFVANTVQNGMTYIQQMAEQRAAAGENRAAQLFGPQLDAARTNAIIANQTATGTQPISPYQKQELNNADRSFNEGVRQFGITSGQRNRELDLQAQANTLYGQSLGKMPVEFQKRYTGLAMMAPALKNYTDALASYNPLDTPNSANYVKINNAFMNVVLKSKEAFNLGVLNGKDLDVLNAAIQNPYTATSRALMNSQGKFDAKGVLTQSANDLRNNFEQELRLLQGMYNYSPTQPLPMNPIPAPQPPAMLQRPQPQGAPMPLMPWDRRKAR